MQNERDKRERKGRGKEERERKGEIVLHDFFPLRVFECV
jgi:hypothetical protein